MYIIGFNNFTNKLGSFIVKFCIEIEPLVVSIFSSVFEFVSTMFTLTRQWFFKINLDANYELFLKSICVLLLAHERVRCQRQKAKEEKWCDEDWWWWEGRQSKTKNIYRYVNTRIIDAWFLCMALCMCLFLQKKTRILLLF